MTEKEGTLSIPDYATHVDDRYLVTEKEKENILKTFFTSTDPLVLKTFPSKEKKKIIILTRISEEFEKGKDYSEKEVNDILKAIFSDYATIRRYLIIYGFMSRTENGSKYWMET